MHPFEVYSSVSTVSALAHVITTAIAMYHFSATGKCPQAPLTGSPPRPPPQATKDLLSEIEIHVAGPRASRKRNQVVILVDIVLVRFIYVALNVR